jgi:crossover junction endodeoxyribonuclease RuvC
MRERENIPSPNTKRILGVDPGSETLGWGVIECNGSKYRGIAYGTVKSSPKDPFARRLAKIYDDLSQVIEQFEPQSIAVEEAFYAQNVKVAMKLGQVRGVVLLLGEKSELEIGEYSPRLIKKTVVGYGNAEKSQVQEMVKILLKLDTLPEPHDAADALAIAICHFQHSFAAARIQKAGKSF